MLLQLRDYQKEGIKTIKEKKNFGIFWQQRLGKTIVAIKGVEEYQKIIFAVPNNTILHWYIEIVNNVFDKTVVIAPKDRKQRFQTYEKFNKTDQMWLIISYDVLSLDFQKDQMLFKNFDYLVFDEAHFLRNSKSKRTKGMLKLRTKANYVIALSGTPAVNNIIDVLKIFKFLYPEKNFGYKYLYKKKFFNIHLNPETKKREMTLKPNMVKEWNAFLEEFCDIKKVYDYLEWLPKTISKTVKLQMNNDQWTHYLKMLHESKRIIGENKEKKENKTITQIIRLQQICLDPKMLNINCSSIKLQWLEEYLEKLFEEDQENKEFVLVFTNFSSIYKINKFKIAQKYRIGFLTGWLSESEKQNVIWEFQSRKLKVLFTNIKIASLGLTLDEATCSIFLDKSWNPIDNEQASFRMVDTKQKSKNLPKQIINVVCDNSIDEKINDVLNNKKNQTEIIYEIEKYIKDAI